MSGNNGLDKMKAEVGELDLLMQRVIDAPRELVFKVFTEAEHVAKWWAPNGYTIPVCKIDLRPGGLWHYCMRSAEGDEHWVRHVYQEIVRPEKIVYTATFADAEANPTKDIPEQLGTVRFIEQEGNKTKLVTTIKFATAEELKMTVKMGMREGFAMTLENLAKYLMEFQ
jgi:uncharacterized protein YndB with AHSA1/START domain